MITWEGSPTGIGELYSVKSLILALRYPYVIAFEPSFIEIRHVETGALSQVIQGNNLRLLFADTPPSTMNGVAYAHAHQQRYGQPYMQQQQQTGRDEILLVSDDRILTLRTAPGMASSASIVR